MAQHHALRRLAARLHALLRRAAGRSVDWIALGDVKLDLAAGHALRDSRPVELSRREWALLRALLQSPGRVFSREQLLNGVWGHDVYVDERTVDVHVGRLRKSINRGRARDPIRTVRGSGYSFDEKFAAI